MKKNISIDQLRIGMYIHKIDGSWLNHSFWRKSFALTQQKEIETLRDGGIAQVWIDTEKGLDVEAAPAGPAGGEAEPEPQPAPRISSERLSLDEEMTSAARICAASKPFVRSLFNEARFGRTLDLQGVDDLVDEISGSLQRNPWALISAARLKTADEYTYMHSVSVCALMIALARQLGLDALETREAGVAGMLHDIGKARMPQEILNKPGKLTDDEFAVMRTHPQVGHDMLVEMGGVGAIPLEVCLHHHEKVDGSGYPHRLQEGGLSLYARMGAVCDVYDAITSDRPYKGGWNPAESLKMMAAWDGHFDKRVFQAFVKGVGIYPIGSLVRLESGLAGVVLDQGSASLLKPRVKVFYSLKSRAYVLPKVVDLARSSDSIAGPENPRTCGIDRIQEFLI
ncbi:MAG: HD-GYP domain-containing protein [Thiomonas sp.]